MDEVGVVEVTNRQAGSGATAVTACVVTSRRGGLTLWTDAAPGAATLAAATDAFVAVALASGVLMVRVSCRWVVGDGCGFGWVGVCIGQGVYERRRRSIYTPPCV